MRAPRQTSGLTVSPPMIGRTKMERAVRADEAEISDPGVLNGLVQALGPGAG